MRDKVIIDTETGGLDSSYHSPDFCWTSQCMRQENGRVHCQRDPLHQRSTLDGGSWHHIRTDSREGLSIADAISHSTFFEPNEGPVLLVGHNISFDLSFIKRLYKLADRPFPQKDLIDPSIPIRCSGQDTNCCSLQLRTPPDGAFKHFNIEPPADKRHTALGDAIATQRLSSQSLRPTRTVKVLWKMNPRFSLVPSHCFIYSRVVMPRALSLSLNRRHRQSPKKLDRCAFHQLLKNLPPPSIPSFIELSKSSLPTFWLRSAAIQDSTKSIVAIRHQQGWTNADLMVQDSFLLVGNRLSNTQRSRKYSDR